MQIFPKYIKPQILEILRIDDRPWYSVRNSPETNPHTHRGCLQVQSSLSEEKSKHKKSNLTQTNYQSIVYV